MNARHYWFWRFCSQPTRLFHRCFASACKKKKKKKKKKRKKASSLEIRTGNFAKSVTQWTPLQKKGGHSGFSRNINCNVLIGWSAWVIGRPRINPLVFELYSMSHQPSLKTAAYSLSRPFTAQWQPTSPTLRFDWLSPWGSNRINPSFYPFTDMEDVPRTRDKLWSDVARYIGYVYNI